jgi:TetR/AcrR family transcriptional regulator, fatty acid metabolism regulator protein
MTRVLSHNERYDPEERRPTDPIREKLIEARRNQILDAAASIFAAKGFHGATTKEIAITAGVSEGTIYNYFDTKFDLLIGIMSRLAEVERLPGELADALSGDVREFFVAAFHHRLGRIEQGEQMLQAILPQVFVHPDLREQFYRQYVLRIATMLEQYVEAQVGLGRIRPVNVPLTVRVLQGMFVGLLVMRILGDDALCAGWAQVPEVLATLVFDGLSVEGGD